MSKTEASPAVASTGTKEKRIALTRGELACIIVRFLDDVKEAKDFPGFLDRMMDGEETPNAIRFDPQAKTGERFQ